MRLQIGHSEFKIKSMFSESGRKKGLKGVKILKPGYGIALRYKIPKAVNISMTNVAMDLGILYILNGEIKAIAVGVSEGSLITSSQTVDTIVEVNADEISDIQPGDQVKWIAHKDNTGKIITGEDFDEYSDEAMLILDNDGNVQGKLLGLDRIHSRKDTVNLYNLCVQAKDSNSDTDYKKVGRAMVRIINGQEARENEER